MKILLHRHRPAEQRTNLHVPSSICAADCNLVQPHSAVTALRARSLVLCCLRCPLHEISSLHLSLLPPLHSTPSTTSSRLDSSLPLRSRLDQSSIKSSVQCKRSCCTAAVATCSTFTTTLRSSSACIRPRQLQAVKLDTSTVIGSISTCYAGVCECLH